MFWNPFKKTKAPYEGPKVPSAKFTFDPKGDITILELIEILQQYITGVGPALPTGWTEMPVGILPPHLMRHFKEVR